MNPTTIETRDTDTESTATTAKRKAPKMAHPAAPKAHRATSGAGSAHNAKPSRCHQYCRLCQFHTEGKAKKLGPVCPSVDVELV